MRTNHLYFLTVVAGSVMVYLLLLVIVFKMRLKMVVSTRKQSFKLIRLIVVTPLMTGLLFTCISCRSDSSFGDPFFQLYKPVVSPASVSSSVVSPSSVFLSLSAVQMPFPVFARVLSDKYSVGIVFSESLSNKSITAEFKDTALQDVFDVVSRHLDSEIVKVGNTYYIGKLRAQDRGILVRRVLGYDNSDLLNACQGVVSDKGKVSVIGSGIVSASDVASVLQRLSELLDYLSSVDCPVWIVQLAFLTINRDMLLEGGLKVSTSGTVSYNVSDNELNLKDLAIDGIVNAAMSSSFADVHSCPMLLCRDGTKSSWKYGKRVPVPRRTVTDAGTVSVTGYDYIDTGFTVSLSVSSSKSGGILDLEIGKSDIESYVDVAPVTSQNVYKFSADMSPLRAYLLGELSTYTDLNKQTDLLNLGKTRGKSSVQVWGQIYRISPVCSRTYPGTR